MTNFSYLILKKDDQKKYFIILLAMIIGALNVLFINNYTISFIIVSIEIIILIYHFIKKNLVDYLGSYLIFLSLSFEFGQLINEDFYGFKNFRILGVNLGIISLLPIVFILLINCKINKKEIMEKSSNLYIFIKLMLLINISGIFIGLTQILINDNNVQRMEGLISSFISVIYNYMAFPFLIIISFVVIIIYGKDDIENLEEYLVAIFIGLVTSMIISYLSGSYGYYGGVKTLIVSNVYRYIPFMLLFPFYKKNKLFKMIFLFGLLGAVLTLIFNINGKMVILYLLIPLGILIITLKEKKVFTFLFFLIILIIVIPFIFEGINYLNNESVLFRSKFRQANLFLKFWDANWIENMPTSPRVRIIEFLNIGYEYLEKPWLLVFGKGYMGTFKDYTGFLDNFIPASYSMNQWDNRSFFGVHETFNSLFLYNGLIGVIIYLYMAKVIFFNMYKNPWILVGGFWFLMVYGYSVTMTAYGLSSLMLGLILIDNSKKRG